MATEVVYADAHLAGAFSTPENAVGNTPLTWAGTTNVNSNYSSRWSLANPVNPFTSGADVTIEIPARKGTNSGNPTIAINLYSNGVLIREILATTSITSTTEQTLTANFSASEVNASDVEIEVVQVSAGGSPSARNSAQISLIRMTADTSVQVKNATGGSTLTSTHVTSGVGIKTGSGDSTVTISHVVTGEGFRTGGDPIGGGSTVTATHVTSGAGIKNVSGGSTVSHVSSTSASGYKSTASGSTSTVDHVTLAGGEKNTSNGSSVIVTHTVTGGGTRDGGNTAGSGGSVLVVSHDLQSTGTKHASGGSQVTVSSTITADGIKANSGSSTAENNHTVSGTGYKNTIGGSLVTVTSQVTGGGGPDVVTAPQVIHPLSVTVNMNSLNGTVTPDVLSVLLETNRSHGTTSTSYRTHTSLESVTTSVVIPASSRRSPVG